MNATIATSECPKCGGPVTLARSHARWSADACKGFNDLRRTYSTWMRNAGVSSSNVGAMMDHTTSAMIDRVYDGRTTEVLAQRIEAELQARAPSSGLTPSGAKEGALCAAGAATRCNACATDTTRAPQIPRTPWTPESSVSSGEVWSRRVSSSH